MRQLDGRGFIPDTNEPSHNWLEEYIPLDDRPQVTAVINEAIRTKSTFELEHRVLRVDGTPGWTFSRAIPLLDETGAIVEWFGAASDITDRKRAEAALAQARVEAELRMTELEAVLDVAPATIWIAHDPECLRITGNRYADEIMKVPHGTNTSATALPGDATVTWRMFREGMEMKPEELPGQVAAATGKSVAAEMIDLVFFDGRVVTLVLSAVPLFDAGGRVCGSVVAGADITPLKKAEVAAARK